MNARERSSRGLMTGLVRLHAYLMVIGLPASVFAQATSTNWQGFDGWAIPTSSDYPARLVQAGATRSLLTEENLTWLLRSQVKFVDDHVQIQPEPSETAAVNERYKEVFRALHRLNLPALEGSHDWERIGTYLARSWQEALKAGQPEAVSREPLNALATVALTTLSPEELAKLSLGESRHYFLSRQSLPPKGLESFSAGWQTLLEGFAAQITLDRVNDRERDVADRITGMLKSLTSAEMCLVISRRPYSLTCSLGVLDSQHVLLGAGHANLQVVSGARELGASYLRAEEIQAGVIKLEPTDAALLSHFRWNPTPQSLTSTAAADLWLAVERLTERILEASFPDQEVSGVFDDRLIEALARSSESGSTISTKTFWSHLNALSPTEVEELDGKVLLRPILWTDAAANCVDEEATAKLLVNAIEAGRLGYIEWCQWVYASSTRGMPTLSAALAEFFRTSGMPAPQFWALNYDLTRLVGSLSRAQWDTLRDTGQISIATLSPGQIEMLERSWFGTVSAVRNEAGQFSTAGMAAGLNRDQGVLFFDASPSVYAVAAEDFSGPGMRSQMFKSGWLPDLNDRAQNLLFEGMATGAEIAATRWYTFSGLQGQIGVRSSAFRMTMGYSDLPKLDAKGEALKWGSLTKTGN